MITIDTGEKNILIEVPEQWQAMENQKGLDLSTTPVNIPKHLHGRSPIYFLFNNKGESISVFDSSSSIGVGLITIHWIYKNAHMLLHILVGN